MQNEIQRKLQQKLDNAPYKKEDYERCYLCNKKLNNSWNYVATNDRDSDGLPYVQYVGDDCFKKIIAAGPEGLKTHPKSEVRLYAFRFLNNQ